MRVCVHFQPLQGYSSSAHRPPRVRYGRHPRHTPAGGWTRPIPPWHASAACMEWPSAVCDAPIGTFTAPRGVLQLSAPTTTGAIRSGSSSRFGSSPHQTYSPVCCHDSMPGPAVVGPRCTFRAPGEAQQHRTPLAGGRGTPGRPAPARSGRRPAGRHRGAHAGAAGPRPRPPQVAGRPDSPDITTIAGRREGRGSRAVHMHGSERDRGTQREAPFPHVLRALRPAACLPRTERRARHHLCTSRRAAATPRPHTPPGAPGRGEEHSDIHDMGRATSPQGMAQSTQHCGGGA